MRAKYLLFVLCFSTSLFSDYQFETVLSGLDDAWSLEFLSEDEIIYTEMPGKLKIANLISKTINFFGI